LWERKVSRGERAEGATGWRSGMVSQCVEWGDARDRGAGGGAERGAESATGCGTGRSAVWLNGAGCRGVVKMWWGSSGGCDVVLERGWCCGVGGAGGVRRGGGAGKCRVAWIGGCDGMVERDGAAGSRSGWYYRVEERVVP
jgi:hypothetical protein